VSTPLRRSIDFLAHQAVLLAALVALSLTNTSGGSAASLAKSGHKSSVQQLYLNYCARCHGQAGEGNGPQAASFRSHLQSFADCNWMELRSDAVLYLVIKNGSAGIDLPPGMPAFDGHLSENQIVSLIGYIRGFCRSQNHMDAAP
jgi:mono/diheme cytochrome c family protein